MSRTIKSIEITVHNGDIGGWSLDNGWNELTPRSLNNQPLQKYVTSSHISPHCFVRRDV